MTRALLQQALDALDTCESLTAYYHDEPAVEAAITAITAALAQPEPVLIRPPSDKDELETNLEQDRREAWELSVKGDDFSDFYNAEAIGGINGYAMLACCDSFYEGWAAAIAKYSAPPAPDARTCAFPVESGSKPVAWLMTTPELGNRIYIDDPVEAARFAGMDNRTVTPLYTAPPAPKGDKS